MEGENINILKKSIRQRRAISSGLYENVSYNYSEEEKNKSKNSIKGFHRKTTSSYFCGSYLSSNLEDELLNNINIDQLYFEKNKNEEKDNTNDSNINKENNIDMILNKSFHSFDSDNKVDEENSIKNKNKIENKIKEEEKENKINHNFVSFKNNLKNIKDKDDRVTNSYLLALGMTKFQNRKEQYIPTVSIIEEEKSDVIDSKSEFSNKKTKIKDKYYFGNHSLIKDNLFFLRKDNKLKIKNIFGKMNNSSKKNYEKEENKNNNVEQNEKNKNEKLGIELSNTLNEIITKNNKKEENKRKNLKKNKVLLLNSFFSNASKNKEEKYKSKIKNNKDINLKGFKNTENNRNNLIEKLRNKIEKKFQLSIKEKIRNSYFSNFIKKRYNTENNINNKGSLKNKIIKNKEIIKNQKNNQALKEDKIAESNKCINLDDTINSNLNINKINFELEKKREKNMVQINYKHKSNIPIITKIEYRPSSKIPHLRQKIIERKEVNSISNVNTTNISNSNSILNKNSAPNRKYISKYKNIPRKKTHSFNKDINEKIKKENCHSVKQRNSINEAIEIIRIERIKSKNKNKPSLKRLNELNKSKNKHNYSSSFIKPININSKSSRDKETNFRISIKKANSGTFRNDISLKLIDEKTFNYPGNKNSTINALKFSLKYEKKYIKIDALKKIEKTFNSENSFFVIICEKITISKKEKGIQTNNYIFVFKSLMKYYNKQNRFIKIYGYENEPNALSVKNININKFDIYRLNNKDNINDELFCFIPIQELKFTTNAIFLCKK